jgi:signal transduction histidine kinase
VYRIGCEAMTNALRHADASTIEVQLEPDAEGFRLRVRDDGRGLPAVRRPTATGMVAMEGRAATIGARLTVASPERGDRTVVMLELPTQEDPR